MWPEFWVPCTETKKRNNFRGRQVLYKVMLSMIQKLHCNTCQQTMTWPTLHGQWSSPPLTKLVPSLLEHLFCSLVANERNFQLNCGGNCRRGVELIVFRFKENFQVYWRIFKIHKSWRNELIRTWRVVLHVMWWKMWWIQNCVWGAKVSTALHSLNYYMICNGK